MYDVRKLRLMHKIEIRNDGNGTLEMMIDGGDQFILYPGDECRYEPDVIVPQNGLEVTSIELGGSFATPHSYIDAPLGVSLACTLRVWNHRGTCRMDSGVVLGVLRTKLASLRQIPKQLVPVTEDLPAPEMKRTAKRA